MMVANGMEYAYAFSRYIILENPTAVKTPNFYYVFNGINMLFCPDLSSSLHYQQSLRKS